MSEAISFETLSKSFLVSAQSCQIRKVFTLRTILKTRPKQLDFELKIEQNQQQQQQKTTVQNSGTRQRGEEPRWQHASIRSVTQTANDPPGLSLSLRFRLRWLRTTAEARQANVEI